MLTAVQEQLLRIIKKSTVETGDDAFSFRDLLTDLRHVASHLGLDFDECVKGASEVYEEEIEVDPLPFNPDYNPYTE
jgi:hypothetical protein